MASVRNIRGIGSTKPIPVVSPIPPKASSAIFKIELIVGVTRYDVTDILLEGEYTDGVTELIGSFSFKIDNSAQTYTSLFSPYDMLRVYMDYGSASTTLVFTGRLERISKQRNNLVLEGRGSGIRTIGKNITYTATDKARSTILSEIIDTYFSGTITTNNLEDDLGTATVNYSEVPFWDVVSDICGQAGFDAYIDKALDFHYFESGSRQNTTDMVIHEMNLLDTGDFSPDIQEVANKVRVYGRDFDGIPLIATSEDSASQTNFSGDIKDLKVTDRNIETPEQAKARADYELANNKQAITVGEVTSLLLPTLQPGENVFISDPLNGINPSYYQIRKFTHKFNNDDAPQTTLTVQKERLDIPNIFKKTIKSQDRSVQNINPFDLNNSIVYDFNSDIGTHTGTEIVDGVLKLQSGQSLGTWESPTTTTSSIVSFAEVRRVGDILGGISISISLDGGSTYTQTEGTGQQGSVTGQNIRLRVIFNNSNTQISAIGVLYS